MAKIVWAVFCQSAIIDRTTNNLSIINQFDELHPTPPPTLQQKKKSVAVAAFQCALACVWEREKPAISETVPVRIRLVGPDKRALPIAEAFVDLRKSRRSRLITNLPGLPIIGEGTYTFIYEVRFGTRWKRVTDVSISVSYAKVVRPEKPTQH